MRKQTLLFALALLFGFAAYSNPKLVQKETTHGELITVRVVVNGSMQLFLHEEESTLMDVESQHGNYLQNAHVYYIGTDENQEIKKLTPFNYKKVLKQKLSNNPELINKLGSRGYRYADLEKILHEHNC